MSYALVINDAGDFQTVDLELVDGRERGGMVKVSSADHTSSYDATLLDSGTAEAMAARMDEWRGLSREELRTKACDRRRNRGLTPMSMLASPPPPKKIDGRKKRGAPTTTAHAASAPISPVVVEDEVDVEQLTDREMLVLMYKKMEKVEKSVAELKNSEAERKKWEDGVTNELTSINAFIELTANRTEADTIGSESTENQEEAILGLETQLTDIAERMPQKLDVTYIYLTESAVHEIDHKLESCAEFGYRIAQLIFSEEEMLMYVEDRNGKKWDWLVDTFTERIKSVRKCRSEIKSHLDQRALRARAALGMSAPLPPTKKRKMEREAKKADLAARVEEMEEEREERRVTRERQSIDAAAKVVMRQKGLIDDEGEDTVYHRPSLPPFRGVPSARGSLITRSAPNPSNRPSRPSFRGRPVERGQDRPAATPSGRPTRPLIKRRSFDMPIDEPSTSTGIRRRPSPLTEDPTMIGREEEQEEVILEEREYGRDELMESMWNEL